ncbi:MAG: efflux RND transporter periplasmic adaptor subunit [Planctomyces sp.]|nr:efflux RND transporter periplasmic adaptor subunit [Planctomyces sp.]
MADFPIHSPRVLLSAGLCLLLVAAGCAERNEFQPPPPPTVTVSRPIEREVVEVMDFTGTTRARSTVELRARVTGYLERIAFQDGADVSEGDLLFVIEQAPFKAELAAAEARVQKAEATLQLATANLERTLRLQQQNATTQQQLDVQKAEAASAQAELATARVAVDQAQLSLNHTEIRAPISGQIGRHLVDVGNLISSGSVPLATIESIDPIHVYFYISEADLLRFMQMLRTHELPDPRESPPQMRMGLANESDFPHVGQLDYRELGLDPGTGTVLRRASFPNDDRTLIPGLFVRLRAELGSPRPRLLVEDRAISADQRGEFLLVVNDQDVVEYRPVKLGRSIGRLRVVEDGIAAADRVIVNGLQRARPGAPVTPEEAPAGDASIAAADSAASPASSNAADD